MQLPYPYRQPYHKEERPPFFVDGFRRNVYFAFMCGESIKSLAKRHDVHINVIEHVIRRFDLVEATP